MNNWNSEMDLTNKTIATRELIKRIPDLKGKNIIVMPSDSHNDILEMIRQNKIDASTLFLIIDNIQSKGFRGKNKQDNKRFYEEDTKSFLKESLNAQKLKALFYLGEDIQNIPFSAIYYPGEDYFLSDFTYADTCSIYKGSDWIKKATFLESLKTGAYFAYTVLLTRSKIEGNEEDPPSKPELILLGKQSQELNHKKMNIIANDIEEKTEHILETKAMIYYYNNIKSPMGILLFQKKSDF